jgi:hypothetical protein
VEPSGWPEKDHWVRAPSWSKFKRAGESSVGDSLLPASERIVSHHDLIVVPSGDGRRLDARRSGFAIQMTEARRIWFLPEFAMSQHPPRK